MKNRKLRWPCKLPYKEKASNKGKMGFKDFPTTFTSLRPLLSVEEINWYAVWQFCLGLHEEVLIGEGEEQRYKVVCPRLHSTFL